MSRKTISTIFAAAAALLLVAPSASQAQVYSPNELTELPRIDSPAEAMRAIERSYPRNLKDAGVGGKVQLAFIVKADGTVDASSVRVMQSERDELATAATEAIAQIRFRPGKKDGSPVASQVVIPISYGVN